MDILKIIDEKYKLTEVDTKEYTSLKVKGMSFTIKAYDAEGLGRVSLMDAKGFFGLMKMESLIVDPFYKDLPLYSSERISAMGKNTLIVEMYDTLLGEFDSSKMKETVGKYAALPDKEQSENWYDDIKLSPAVYKQGKKMTEEYDAFCKDILSAYINIDAGEVEDPEEKKKKASVYVEGLLQKGGISTDIFKKELGQEATEKLFRKYLFGTGE